MVTAKAFIEQVMVPYREGWGYIYGTCGKLWTRELQDNIEHTTDSKRAASRQYGSQWIGKMVTDCSGLLRWALRQLGETIVHQARYQYTDYCNAKGKLINGARDDGLPILPGTAVFLQAPETKIHHVGVYVGNDTVIEAKGAKYGVVTSHLDHWDHWGELKMVDYTDADSLEGGEIKMPEVQKALVCNPNNWLNVRSGAGSSFPVRFQVPKGSTVDVITMDGDWWQIRYGGQIGWAVSKYLELIPSETPENGPESVPDDDTTNSPDELHVPVLEALDAVERAYADLGDEIKYLKSLIKGGVTQ